MTRTSKKTQIAGGGGDTHVSSHPVVVCMSCGRAEGRREAFRRILREDGSTAGWLCGDCAPRCELDLYREDGLDDDEEES